MHKLLLSLLGASLAVLALAFGLSRFVAAPNLSGVRPPDALYALHFSPRSGFAGRSERLDYRQLEALLARSPTAELSTAQIWSASIGRTADQMYRQRVAYTTGNLLHTLGLDHMGRLPADPSMPQAMIGGADRQIVLSNALAEKLFGSAGAALNQNLLLPDLNGIREPKQLSFNVAAVVTSDFKGPVIEDPVDAWIPMAAWHSLILPAHQTEDIRDMAPDFVAVLDDRSSGAISRALDDALADIGELANLRALVLKGMGPRPERRLALLDWSRMLQLSVVVLALSLLLLHVSQRWLKLEHDRGDDFVRSILGESNRAWWRRHAVGGLSDVSTVLGIATLSLGLMWLLAGLAPALPVRDAIAQLKADSVTFASLCGGFVALLMVPMALHRLSGGIAIAHTLRSHRRVGANTLTIVLLAGCACFMGVAAAYLASARAEHLLSRDLGIDTRTVWSAPLSPRNEDRRAWFYHQFDRRSPTPLLPATGESARMALATVAPLSTAELAMARIRAGEREWRGAMALNEVSDHYFDILGVRIEGRCQSLADMQERDVVVNRAFIERYAHGMPAERVQLAMSLMADGVLPLAAHICGTIPNVQFGDVRGEATPMVYRRLLHIGGARVVVASGAQARHQLQSLATRLDDAFPDLHLGEPRPLQAKVEESLAQDIGMARLSQWVSIAVFALSTLLAAQSLLLAARMRLPQLSVQWALGARKLRLLRALAGTDGFPLLIAAGALASGCLWLWHAIPGVRLETLLKAWAWGSAALLIALLLSTIPVLRFLREQRLAQALAEVRG